MGNSKDKYRICIFSDERSTHTKRWVRGLRDIGHSVDLISLKKDKDDDVGGISFDLDNKLSYLKKIAELRSLVDNLKPDIFHPHYASSFGFLASFVDHPRKVLSVWGNDVIVFPHSNFIFKAMVRRALRSARYITATSRFLESAVKKLTPEITAIRVIAFGIDTRQFRYLERPDNGTVEIGIAKSLRPKYGIDILIRAFKELSRRHDNIRLSIAGRGEHAEKYKKLAVSLGLSDRIEFKGFIDHAALPGYFSRISIFAMPSVSDGESFGVAALEASATGLPVVASNVGGVPEVVSNGETGILVERKNVSELASALEKLIVNPELRRRMGKAGREFVEKNYRWEENLMMMDALYREMMR